MGWHRRVQRFYWAALVIWVVVVVADMAVFGGIDSPVTAIGLLLSFLVIVTGLVSTRMSLKEDSTQGTP